MEEVTTRSPSRKVSSQSPSSANVADRRPAVSVRPSTTLPPSPATSKRGWAGSPPRWWARRTRITPSATPVSVTVSSGRLRVSPRPATRPAATYAVSVSALVRTPTIWVPRRTVRPSRVFQ